VFVSDSDGEGFDYWFHEGYPITLSKRVNSLKGASSLLIKKKGYPSIQKKLWGIAH